MAQQGHKHQKTQQIQDNFSAISTSPTTPSSRNFGSPRMMRKIWLNKALYIIKLVFVCVSIFTPFAAQAGVFSFIGGLIGNKEADAGTNQTTSQNLKVLEANVGPSSVVGTGGSEIAMVDGSALSGESIGSNQPADQSTQISLYVVRQGDSLSQIAKIYGVSVNTIIWANNIRGSIHEGDELVILPVSGVNHTVVKGDTIRSISSKYHADMGDIKSFNGIQTDNDLIVGSTIIIPDGELAVPSYPTVYVPGAAINPTEKLRGVGGPFYKDYYRRPIDGGVKTQGLHGYNAIDFGAPIGTPIHASADGVVIMARSGGYNGGYGSYVVVSHANNTQTLYAHMSRVYATQGQVVQQGDIIGLVGSTGKSTGPHVHFEVRGAVNPF